MTTVNRTSGIKIVKDNGRTACIHERADANWKHIGAKAKAIGFFSRHLSDKSNQRKMLNGFMERMKTQKNSDKEELEENRRAYGNVEANTIIKTLRSRSPAEFKHRITPDGPTYTKYEVKPGCKCALCNKVFPAFHEHEALPCRVCDDVFHRRCLESCGDLNTSDKHNIDMAKTNIGWSCPKCANIALLLSTEEIRIMTEQFDELDINRDAQVSLDEYLRHHARRHSLVDRRGNLLLAEKERLSKEHRRMDQDGDGYLDWWEFVNHECKVYLMKKDKHDLADLLTNKELMAAKAVFKMLDKDGDGKIKLYEAKEAFANWFRRFEMERRMEGMDLATTDSEELEMHAKIATMCIMDADASGMGDVQWKDYILDQALYIICCRPNHAIPAKLI